MRNSTVEQNATVGAARRLLTRALDELDEARTLDDQRQAGEKIWLSLVTAGRAVLRCAGDPAWRKTTAVAERVERLEVRRFGSPRLAAHLSSLQSSVHGACFYAGDEKSCDVRSLRATAQIVGEQIDHAAAMCRITRERKR